MPYQKKEELPDAVKALPAHGQEIWMAAFNSAWEQYGGDDLSAEALAQAEEKCFATAWAAVENKYKKEGDEWVMKSEHSQSGDGWFEIFRTGTHTDSQGRKREWTDADLEYIASSYNPEVHEAPVVIGHPNEDSPAYGWIEGLKKEGDKLLAKPKQLAEEFLKKFRRGEYKKVSMAVYPDMTLRHIGFLGAVPPALKGLKQATFSEKPAWVIESEFFMESCQPSGPASGSESHPARREALLGRRQETVKLIFQRMRDWMIDKFSLEEADKIISAYDIDALKYEPAKSAEAAPAPLYSEIKNKGGTEMMFKEFLERMKGLFSEAEKGLSTDTHIDTAARFSEAEVQAREAKAKKDAETLAFAENEKLKKEKEGSDKKLREIETKARKDGIAAFCEGLCKEGKLTPALRKIIEPIMNFVSDPTLTKGGEGGFVIEFSEGVKKPALDGIKDFLTELPKAVTFREVTPSGGPAAGGSAGEKLSALTKKKMEGNKDLSYSSAFSEISRENPELAKEYLEEIRPKK